MVDITWNSPAQYTRQPHFDNDRMAGSVPVWKSDANEPETATSPHKISLNEGEKMPNGKPPSFSFGEFLDIVNPLQHIPVVNNLYRNFTGDDISSVAQIVGGSIYGGPLGGVASLVNVAVQEHSGQSAGAAIRRGFSSQQTDFSVYEEARMAGMNKHHEKRGDDDRPRVDIQLSDNSEVEQKPRYHFNT